LHKSKLQQRSTTLESTRRLLGLPSPAHSLGSTASFTMRTSRIVFDIGKESPLRLLALPLCRNPELVYYYASKRKSASKAGNEDPSLSNVASTSGSSQTADNMTEKASRLVTKATNKATEQWEKFGKAPQGNWKHRIYMQGEKLMDRVDYEEWLLKALDASAAPKLLTRRPKPGDLSEGTATSSSEDEQIPLYFPSSFMSDFEVVQDLKQMLDHREPHHNDLMKKSLYVAPLTFPFAILPVVPNFPLFYVLWRAWSHWRALKSSQYLQSLITHQQLAPKHSSILDELYAKHSPFKPADKSDSSASSGDGVPQILLNEVLIKELLEKFELEEQAGTDLRRAVSQLEARLKDPNKSIKQ